ncbi:zinc finger protein 786 [Cephus cinctus]|uniref:Zinc finger protein 786 n=1 Tax=Cephus cinctus TaxID=211228 RepID=A0AAJ7RAP4_CEPCN|nr:zinc finger protein 786 [Cephus cinctus]
MTPYQCRKCFKFFKSSKSCSNHRSFCGKDKKFRCAFCDYRSHQRANVLRHLNTQHPETINLNQSDCVVNLIENFSVPEENHDNPMQTWKIEASGFAELKIPKANFSGKKPTGQFGCVKCGRCYMRKDSLQRHVQWECGKEPQFQCPFCPQRCKRKAHWLRHIRRQHLDQIAAEDLSITGLKWAAAWQRWSSVPSIMWRSTASLSKGLTGGTSNPEGFNCPACGRVYKLKSSLRNHQKWECGKEPQFQCPHCVYRAKQKMHIARHMERMHKEKIYKQELV